MIRADFEAYKGDIIVTDVRRKPDFICIGPERTATSSLYVILKSHPGFYMAPQKEIRYWNEGNLIPEHSIPGVLFSRHWHFRHLRKRLIKQLGKVVLGRSPAGDLAWYVRYAFGRRSARWYSSLFEHGEGLITGDISPLYYHLPEEVVREIAEYNPDIRIIIFVRDPVARTWSKVRMNLLKHRNRRFEDVEQKEFYDAFDSISREWVPYAATARLWKKYFRDVYIGFFDDLKSDPGAFFRDIIQFLGAERTGDFDLPAEKTNLGLPVILPEPFRAYLIGQYRDEILQSSEPPFAEYAGGWARKYGL